MRSHVVSLTWDELDCLVYAIRQMQHCQKFDKIDENDLMVRLEQAGRRLTHLDHGTQTACGLTFGAESMPVGGMAVPEGSRHPITCPDCLATPRTEWL